MSDLEHAAALERQLEHRLGLGSVAAIGFSTSSRAPARAPLAPVRGARGSAPPRSRRRRLQTLPGRPGRPRAQLRAEPARLGQVEIHHARRARAGDRAAERRDFWAWLRPMRPAPTTAMRSGSRRVPWRRLADAEQRDPVRVGGGDQRFALEHQRRARLEGERRRLRLDQRRKGRLADRGQIEARVLAGPRELDDAGAGREPRRAGSPRPCPRSPRRRARPARARPGSARFRARRPPSRAASRRRGRRAARGWRARARRIRPSPPAPAPAAPAAGAGCPAPPGDRRHRRGSTHRAGRAGGAAAKAPAASGCSAAGSSSVSFGSLPASTASATPAARSTPVIRVHLARVQPVELGDLGFQRGVGLPLAAPRATTGRARRRAERAISSGSPPHPAIRPSGAGSVGLTASG